MSSANPPYPYFNGITYNNAYFETSGAGLSRSQANALYLRKTTPDTATALETFNTGIKTNTINAVSTSLDLVANSLGLNPNSASATTNIHTNSASSSGTVNIMGSNGGSSGTVNICVGSGGGVTASECNISTGTTIGTVAIGNSANAVNVNSMALSLGTATKTLTVQTPITINYAPASITAQNMIGWTTTRVNTAQPLTLGGVRVIEPQLITTAGVYLFSWSTQYNNSSAVTYLFTNIANGGASSTATSPNVNTTTNWGNSSLGNFNGSLLQSSNGTLIITCTANTYYNLVCFTNGGTAATIATWLQVIRIA